MSAIGLLEDVALQKFASRLPAVFTGIHACTSAGNTEERKARHSPEVFSRAEALLCAAEKYLSG